MVEIFVCVYLFVGKVLVFWGIFVEVYGFGELFGCWGELNYDIDMDNISNEGEMVDFCLDEDFDFVLDVENLDMDMSGDWFGFFFLILLFWK